MKKIINSPDTLVSEMLNGIALAHPEVEYLQKYNIIKRKEINPDKVTLISGGGSGHEPAHAGFVGKGMLDAAVAGDIFASPSQIQIYQAIRATASKKGTLLIIKNYSNFMDEDPELKKHVMHLFFKNVLPWWEEDVKRFVVEGEPKPFNLYLID